LSRFRAKRGFCRSGCAILSGPRTLGALVARVHIARRCRRTDADRDNLIRLRSGARIEQTMEAMKPLVASLDKEQAKRIVDLLG